MNILEFLCVCGTSAMKPEPPEENEEEAGSVVIENSFTGMPSSGRSSVSSRSSGAQIHPISSDQPSEMLTVIPGEALDVLQEVYEVHLPQLEQESGSSSQPKGILKSGTTCISVNYGPRSPPEGQALAAPRCDPSTGPDLFSEDGVSEGVTNAWLNELTQHHTLAPSREVSPVPVTYPITAEDRSLNNESEAEGAERHSPLRVDTGVETEPNEASNLQQLERGLCLPFEPPPPCSQCNNEHHSGFFDPSTKFSCAKLKDVIVFSLDTRSGVNNENIYKGQLDGRPVFVARQETNDKASFFSEIDIWKDLRHPNIVTLRGYCDENNHQALVFNFVCNNTLAFHLSSRTLQKPLQWQARANIAIELARGLVYLHDRHVVHGNVNAMNVFVTHDFLPLIGNFSFAKNIGAVRYRILQDRSEDKIARGWPWSAWGVLHDMLSGYLPPEYGVGKKISEKLDIYAFGVILLELVAGRSAFFRENKTRHFLGEWGRQTIEEIEPQGDCQLVATMADPRLKISMDNKCDILRMIKVAELCTSKDPKERPLMPSVLEMLTGDIDITRSQAHPSPAVHRREYPDDHNTLVVHFETPLPPSDDDQRIQMPSESPAQALLRYLREKCRARNDSSERAAGWQNHPTSRGWFTPASRCKSPYYDGSNRRPTSSGCAPKRSRSGTHHHGSFSGSSTPYPRSPVHLSSRRFPSLTCLGGVPMSSRWAKGMRIYSRRSGGENFKRKGPCQGKFENWRTSRLNLKYINTPD